MAARSLRFVPVFLLLSFCSIAYTQEFPSISEIVFSSYQTEVQITNVLQESSAYATEYYDSIGKKGALKIYFQGEQQLVYYDNSTFQITEVNGPNCTATDADISDYYYTSIYYGWLHKDPIIVGPSAALWFAQTKKPKYANKQDVRSIKCDKFVLDVKSSSEDLTYEYYFAPTDWTTPYRFRNLRVPIRIRIVGSSSKYAADNVMTKVDQISDFAYFKPSIEDVNNLLPPVGIGCKERQKTDYMPKTPKVFQYSAEVVDLLAAKEHEDVEIQFQKTWFDSTRNLARRDIYSRKNGFRSRLADFDTGTLYRILDDGTCEMAILRDTDFQTYDYGMTSRIKTPKEALNLDGDFYDMGKRSIRGMQCDTYESVQFDAHFKGIKYYKLVVTAYFTESSTKVGINSEMESRIPVYYIINGYETPEKKTLQLQYNIFGFDDVIWPEIYASFRLDRCYTKADSKAYFVLVFPVEAKDAAKLEDIDQMFIEQLRATIAENAQVPEMRIPYLKADYKPSGVFVTGLMLERPPAFLQFYYVDEGPTVTRDKFFKVIPDAENLEECSYACVDEKNFLCKGFYFCGKACFVKSNDLFDNEDGKSEDLGVCTEYLRAEIESTNFRQSFLVDALGYLDLAVSDGNVSVAIRITDGEEIFKVQDVIIGDGPYTGDDSTIGKPFVISNELRKLDSSLESVRTVEYAGSLHECYKRCKEAGSLCSSFSYCPDATESNKECMISSELIVKGVSKDTDLIPDKNCNIYNLKYSDYFIPYPEKVSLLAGDKVIRGVPALERCAASCRMEKNFTCRGFEYCKAKKICTLHEKHILDLKPDQTTSSTAKQCTHYAARFIVDYVDLGGVLIDDQSNVRYGASLEECAQLCSEKLQTNCKSFNYCPGDEMTGTDSTCAVSIKLLTDNDTTTTEKGGCKHYEKRASVHDWDKTPDTTEKPDEKPDEKPKQKPAPSTGYTAKGFTGLVIGMIALGIIVGALGFVFYSYMRSRGAGGGMAVRFMKNDS